VLLRTSVQLRNSNAVAITRPSQIFRDRGFAVDTAALGRMSVVFVPFFFFGSV
jgi:hypothetical protein